MRARACGAAFAIVMLAATAGLAKDKAECANAAVSGQELERSQKLTEARAQLASCATDECPDVIAKDCTRWIKELDGRIPTLDLAAHGVSGAAATVDGRDVPMPSSGMTLDPGTHVVVVRAPGYVTQTKNVDLAEGAHAQLDVPLVAQALAPTPTPTPTPTPVVVAVEPEHRPHRGGWFVTAIATSALALGGFATFAGFGVAGNSDQSGLRTSCAPFCTQAQIGPVSNEFTWANVGLGVGIVAIVASAVTWYLAVR